MNHTDWSLKFNEYVHVLYSLAWKLKGLNHDWFVQINSFQTFSPTILLYNSNFIYHNWHGRYINLSSMNYPFIPSLIYASEIEDIGQ